MNIQLRAIDESGEKKSELFYHARNLKIQITSKSFHTPIRALSNGELSAKAQIPTPISLNSNFSGIHKELFNNETKKMLSDNHFAESLIKNLENYQHRMQHGYFTFSLIQPSKNAVDTHLINDSLKISFLRRIIDIQSQSEMPVISIPWLYFKNTKQIIDIFNQIEKAIDNEIIFFIDIGADSSIIDEVGHYLLDLAKTGRIHFIGLLFKPRRKALISYDILWDLVKNENIALIVAGMERYDSNYLNLSTIHMNEFILGDIFLPIVKRAFPSTNSNENMIKKPGINTIRLFDRETLTLPKFGEFDFESWKRQAIVDINDSKILNVFNNINEANEDERKLRNIGAISKIHECIASQKEITLSQEFIQNNETNEYISQKHILNDVLSRQRKSSQTRLV